MFFHSETEDYNTKVNKNQTTVEIKVNKYEFLIKKLAFYKCSHCFCRLHPWCSTCSLEWHPSEGMVCQMALHQ